MIKISTMSVFILLILLPHAHANPKSSPFEAWTASVSSDRGVALLLNTINAQHPKLITENFTYGGDIFGNYRRIPAVLKKLGDKGSEALQFQAGRRAHLSLPANQVPDFVYDAANVESVKVQLRNVSRVLETFAHRPLRNFVSDAKYMSGQSRPEVLTAFLLLSPLIYSGTNGEPTMSIIPDLQEWDETIDQTTAAQLDNAYNDLYVNHLSPLLRPGGLSALLGETPLDDVPDFRESLKEMQLLLRVKELSFSDPGKTVEIWIEEVPKLVAILRGYIGFDCSLQSVPLYPLLDQVRVFWIYKKAGSTKSKPLGYLLMYEDKIGDKVTPYVITINGGRLTAQQGRMALYAVSHLYGTDEVLLPTADSVVNTDAQKRALYWGDPRAHKQKVSLPKEWRHLDSGRDRQQHSGYYAASRLSAARRLRFDNHEITLIHQVEVLPAGLRYAPSGRIDSISGPDRIKLFMNARDYDNKRTKLGADLELEDHQIEAASIIWPHIGNHNVQEMTKERVRFVMQELSLSAPKLIDLLPSYLILPTLNALKGEVDSATYVAAAQAGFESLINSSRRIRTAAVDALKLIPDLPEPPKVWRGLAREVYRSDLWNYILAAILSSKDKWDAGFTEIVIKNLGEESFTNALSRLRNEHTLLVANAPDFAILANLAISQYRSGQMSARNLLAIYHFVREWNDEIWKIWLSEWNKKEDYDQKQTDLVASLINHTNWPSEFNIVNELSTDRKDWFKTRLLLKALAKQKRWPAELWPLIKEFLQGLPGDAPTYPNQIAGSWKMAALAAVASRDDEPNDIYVLVNQIIRADERLHRFYADAGRGYCEALLSSEMKY